MKPVYQLFLLMYMAYLENLIHEICALKKVFSIYYKPTLSGKDFISLFIGDKLVRKDYMYFMRYALTSIILPEIFNENGSSCFILKILLVLE